MNDNISKLLSIQHTYTPYSLLRVNRLGRYIIIFKYDN